MTLFDRAILLGTGLLAIYLLWRFFTAYQTKKELYFIYYMLGFGVLLVSGLLLIFLGWDILKSPLVLTVATLIPLGISLGLANQFYPMWKKPYAWFALVGFLAIAFTSISGHSLKKLSVPIFHGVAGLVIFITPILLERAGKAAKGFWFVGLGGALIGIGGIALAFLTSGSQLLFFSYEFILKILAPLLFLMALSFTWGFTKNFNK